MSWKKKIALGFSALLAVILLFLVIEHFRGKWGLARWKARMSAKGEPISIVAITPQPPPENDNGMPALIAAAGQVSFPWKLRPPAAMYAAPAKVIVITRVAEWPGGGRPATNITWKAVSEAVQQRDEALDAAVKALEYPKFNARLDYYLGWSLRLPHFGQFYRLSDSLCAAALAGFKHGNLERGIERLEAAIRLAATLEDEPLVISQLVRMRILHAAFENTWQAAHAEGLEDAHLKRLQEAWAEQDFLRPMRRALSMEHVTLSHEFERFRQADVGLDRWIDFGGGGKPPPLTINSPARLLVAMIEHAPETFRNGVYTPIWKFAWSHQDELQCLKTVERGLKAWDRAIAQQSALPVRHFGAWEYRGLAEDPIDSDQNFYDGMRYIISPRADGFYPAMKRAFSAQTLCELAMTGLALQRYKLRFGKSAAKLEELVPNFLPKLPRDFMNGEVLKYAPPLLYSVGVDGEDNGGDVGTPATRGFSILEGRDFVWPREASPEETRARFESSP